MITQSNGWTQVTGTFTATGGEQYITIGSFVSYASSGVSVHTPDSMTSYTPTCAYYFIDDVSVKEEPLITVTSNPNGWVCAGTPTTFTASSSGGSVTTYSWSPSQGSVTCLNPTLCSQVYSANSYTAATTYTLTCTLPSGCTTTATYTYAQLAAPLTLNAGADQSICLGPSVVLSATVTGTYNSSSWAILNSSTLCSGCTSTTVTPTTTTQYVYTATQTTTGCTKKDTVTVTVTPLPVTIVSPPGATTCGGCFGFTTNPVGATYSWGIGNSVSSSCPTCATFNACWGTPFDTTGVTGHITVSIVDANGCRGSAVGYIPSCCPFKDGQEYVYPNLVNDSTTRVDNVSYPSLFWYNTATQYYEAGHKELSINGTFIVDRNTRFKGCEIKMGPNAKIIVRPGIKLEFTDTAAFDSKVYACSDQWYGIEVDGTNASSKVTVLNGTTIEDAKNAIVSINGGNFFIDGGNSTNKFNKNNIGVLIKAYTGAHPGVIRKTIFACDAPGQPGSTAGVTSAGANCRAPVSGKGFAGVYVESCTNVIIGDSTSLVHRNLFERTQFGVYSKNSNVKIWNNDFKYFTTTVVAPNVPANGIAVYATATKQNPKALTVGRTGNYKAKNKFTKCSYGVMAHNYIDLSCEFNRFDSCMTKGIYTLNCLSRTVLINADTLTECVGINIACVESNNSTVTITNNSINSTQAYVANNFGNTGIYVVNAVLVNVNLKIQYNSVKKMRNGIWVSRVNKAKITDNNPITFMSGQPMTQLAPCIGIKLEEVTNSMIRQNQVGFNSNPTAAQHATLFGIHMTNCKNDTVSKNLLLKVGSGIFLKGTCNPSILACNSMTNCYYGVNFNYLNGYTTPVSVNHQITWGSSTAFHTTGNTWTGTMAGGFDLRGRIMPININGIKWYYPNATTPPTSSMFLNSLYGNVLQDTTTGDKCSQMLAPPAQTQEQTRNYTLAGICKTPRTYDTLNSAFQYHDNVFAYRMLRENPSWKSLGTADDSYYANFYTTHTSGNIGKFADVEDDIASGNVSSATSTLSSITPSGQYEVNRKAMLEVYLQTWAIDSMNLDSAQQAVLLGIINQGTLTGGTSVFDARNMLNEEVHDSTNLRMQNSTFTASTPHAVSPVYPNPTNGQLSIDIALEQDVPGVFELFDLSGRLVGAWQFTGGQRKYTFDVSFLPSGTYIYCVRMEGEMLKSDRIIIIKE
ncbi:MAG TPA: T9SS type A sorting domain-containing protein [Bacteroidia bacterium]|nr:T9SS type A sorting domain-containing protein [Bacteroidia bacterium]